MTKTDHIFIVGLSRTGTNLVRNMLNRSPEIGLADETHYLPHIIGFKGYQHEFEQVGDISTDAGAQKVVDYIYNVTNNQWRGRDFWGWIQRHVDRDVFLQALLASERTEHTLLDLAMDFYAKGQPIRGEKTPAHLHSVPTLLKWYPNAKVIHTFRDIRAIFVSQKQWNIRREKVNFPYQQLRHFGPILDLFLSIHLTISWTRAAQLHENYQRLYPKRYMLSKFETIASDPKTQLKKLCDFLEVDFSEALLDLDYQNTTVRDKQEVNGIDTGATDRWRKQLPIITNKWLIFWNRRYLKKFGYLR